MHPIRALPLLLALLILPATAASAQIVGVSIRLAPPPIPVYVQPPIPGPGYIWAPGYWAWGDDDYYWVPGTWVLAPTVGYLWTPGYWYWRDAVYVWRPGYWGPRVGFYGGINYGCGYYGAGYVGGAWRGRVFAYNTAVTNIGTVRITNVYVDKTVIINKTTTNVSFHGGQGGTTVRPTAEEQLAEHDKHVPPSFMQRTHERAASTNRALFAKVNDGKPVVAASSRPGQFSEKGILAAKNAELPPGAGALNSTSGPLHTAKGSGGVLKGASLGSNTPPGVKKDQRTTRAYQGKGTGSSGISGGASGQSRGTTMHGPPPHQDRGATHPAEGKRSPNTQGSGPIKGDLGREMA